MKEAIAKIKAEYERANRSSPGNVPRSGYEDGYINGLEFAVQALSELGQLQAEGKGWPEWVIRPTQTEF